MKQPKARSTRQPSRAAGRWPQFDAGDIDSWRSDREHFRTAHAGDIERVADAIGKSGILRRIDSTYWRHPRRVDLATVKIAEVIVDAFRGLKQDAAFRNYLEQNEREAERGRGRHKRESAKAIFTAEPFEAARHAYLAADYERKRRDAAERLSELRQKRREAKSRRLDRLTIELVGVLLHLTELGKHYILSEIIASIPKGAAGLFDVVWECYPDCTSDAGFDDPATRYDRAERKSVSAWQTRQPALHWLRRDEEHGVRAALFVGDDRFPLSLYDHRTPRRVPRP